MKFSNLKFWDQKNTFLPRRNLSNFVSWRRTVIRPRRVEKVQNLSLSLCRNSMTFVSNKGQDGSCGEWRDNQWADGSGVQRCCSHDELREFGGSSGFNDDSALGSASYQPVTGSFRSSTAQQCPCLPGYAHVDLKHGGLHVNTMAPTVVDSVVSVAKRWRLQELRCKSVASYTYCWHLLLFLSDDQDVFAREIPIARERNYLSAQLIEHIFPECIAEVRYKTFHLYQTVRRQTATGAATPDSPPQHAPTVRQLQWMIPQTAASRRFHSCNPDPTAFASSLIIMCQYINVYISNAIRSSVYVHMNRFTGCTSIRCRRRLLDWHIALL